MALSVEEVGRNYEVKTIHDVDKISQELRNLIEEHGRTRLHISITFHNDTCYQCGLSIEVGKERDYCGRTYCLACKSSEVEFDEGEF